MFVNLFVAWHGLRNASLRVTIPIMFAAVPDKLTT